MAIKYSKICEPLFSGLNSKQKQVVFRRFGLDGGQGETLESIGQSLGLTRERVRQIIEAVLAKIRKQNLTPQAKKITSDLKKYVKDNGGFKKEESFFGDPIFDHQQSSRNWINFLLALSGEFQRFPETDDLHCFWATGKKVLPQTERVLRSVKTVLLRKKQPLGLKDLVLALGFKDKTKQKFLLSALEVSKEILRTSDGKYGLRTWPEVRPKNVGDLALLILRQAKKPLHFVEIASLIDKFFPRQKAQDFSVVAAAAGQTRPKTNFQTVHNKLIKDPQFVLVGRGIYALKEWGYEPGTVQELISNILKQEKQPLSKKEILEKILSQRQVKPSTVILNLGNKKFFLKSEDDKYSLREA